MHVDSEQLPQHLQRGLQPLYTIVGDEPLLALEALDRLRTRARAEGYDERHVLTAEPGFDWGSLAAAGASLSLFAARRLIELRIPNGKPGVAGADAIERYCDAVPPDTVTVVHLPALDWKSKQAQWFLALEERSVVVDARSVERARLPAWLRARLAAQGQSAAAQTLDFVAERVEGNLLAAWQEVQKLGLMFAPGKLADADVRKAVTDVARFDIDGLADALLAGNPEHYVRVLDALEAEGAALPLILWSISNALRSVHRLAGALERGMPVAAALREARVFGPRRTAIERAASRWPRALIEAALTRLATIDRAVKGLDRLRPWDGLRDLGLGLFAAAQARGRVSASMPPV